MTNTTDTRTLLQIELEKQGCDCQDCRSFAWDKVIEIEGRK